ncbi:hypothetical protein Taro_040935 [Colocasia esculenta]|uniref:Uncharacterized protein n=1 Tax=Colocasia esculenta TaxID=4460 RepID=A0A843WNB8_COLES|nr:hypothetical protein [Colocasia esculenta]
MEPRDPIQVPGPQAAEEEAQRRAAPARGNWDRRQFLGERRRHWIGRTIPGVGEQEDTKMISVREVAGSGRGKRSEQLEESSTEVSIARTCCRIHQRRGSSYLETTETAGVERKKRKGTTEFDFKHVNLAKQTKPNANCYLPMVVVVRQRRRRMRLGRTATGWRAGEQARTAAQHGGHPLSRSTALSGSGEEEEKH